MYDVIVIGAGPVGSYTAGKLVALGHRVALLERRSRPGEKPCTGIVSAECVRSFSINEGAIVRQVNSARLFSPSGRLIRLWREQTQACIIDRASLEASFIKQAIDRGSDYLPQTMVTDIEVADDRVFVAAQCQGKDTTFDAKTVMLSTGFGSSLATRLGFGKVGDFVMGAQAEVESDLEEVEVYLGKEVAPGFFGWLVPTSPRRALVGLMTRQYPQVHIEKLLRSLAGQGKIASAEVKVGYAGIPLRPLSRTYDKRLLVVGDAAGQVKPTTCGGIYFGLLCADIAADTLHRALQSNDLSAKALSEYERGWRKKLARELKIGYYARKFYERLSDKSIDKLFEFIKTRGIDTVLLQDEELSFDWHSVAVLRLVKYPVVSRTLELMKTAFRLGRTKLT